MIAYWDSKKLPESNKNCSNTVNRLVVVITGCKIEKLLGIPKLQYDTGKGQAEAVYDLITEWSLQNKFAGLRFDTTARNTGRNKEACVLLEKKKDFHPIYFACRHHIHELVVGTAVDALFGASTGPNIKFFSNFQKK